MILMFDIAELKSCVVIPIVVACFVLGYVIKNYIPKIPNKVIPLIMIIIGIIINIVITILTPDTSITVVTIIAGAASGLASTGSYELIRTTFGLTKRVTSLTTTETVTNSTTVEKVTNQTVIENFDTDDNSETPTE